MQNLTTRIVSALAAVSILYLTIYFFKLPGMVVFAFLVGVVGIYETSQLLFKIKDEPKVFQFIFLTVAINLFNYLTKEKFISHSYEFMIGTFVLITGLALSYHKEFKSIDSVFSFIGKFMVGLVYSASLPALIISILMNQKNGLMWFLFLLATVFSGDIGAFIFGTFFGKTKIAPLLSPKKSLEGSLGGLLFSSLAGLAFSFIIPDLNMAIMIGLGFLGGGFGQVGDFFESLIKRIAGVKDSGSIMPGHGGVLDRLDGVYFASPLFYIAINYIV